jgi:hypothetical protein
MAQPAQQAGQRQEVRDRRRAEQIAAVLAAGLTITATASAVRRVLAPLGLASAAITAAVKLTRRIPVAYLPPVRVTPTATNSVRQEALNYRAWYLLNAAQRISDAIADRKPDQTDREALDKALARERSYFAAHVRMQRRRFQVATEVDRMAAVYGDRLGWLAVLDTGTTPDCRHAAFKDFLVSEPPEMGLPGAVHPRCRCRPTAPWHTELLR